MRKSTLSLLILFLCVIQSVTAQVNHDTTAILKRIQIKTEKAKNIDKGACRKLYVGFSLGVNNPAGVIGFDLDVPVVQHVSVGTGFGVSTWGNKLYVDGKYYLKPCHRGFALGVGLTNNTGNNNFKRHLYTINGKEDVTLKLDQETTAFFGAYYFWTLGRKFNRMFVEAGYSVPFSSYKYTEVSGDPLSSKGEGRIQDIAPGGLMIGLGFSFGVH